MRRVDAGTGLIVLTDGTTAACAGFNAAWLAGHWLAGTARARRLAAVTLALVNTGVLCQAAFAEALFWARALGQPTEPFFAPASWAGARLPLLAGTALLSLLIWRRVR